MGIFSTFSRRFLHRCTSLAPRYAVIEFAIGINSAMAMTDGHNCVHGWCFFLYRFGFSPGRCFLYVIELNAQSNRSSNGIRLHIVSATVFKTKPITFNISVYYLICNFAAPQWNMKTEYWAIQRKNWKSHIIRLIHCGAHYVAHRSLIGQWVKWLAFTMALHKRAHWGRNRTYARALCC